jgi:para-nitrobenzyl esterase
LNRAILALALALGACSNDTPPAPEPCAGIGKAGTVVIETGPLRGAADGRTCAFLGVPYAAPPVGSARFRPPGRAPSWSEVRSATSFGPACPQVGARFEQQSEDCLLLNVWSPSQARAELVPVLVFMHGGGNVTGSASDPELRGAWLAAQTGTLVVSVDYRLGALGYLAHPSLSAEDPNGSSGNYGLLDQIAALEWIQRNATAFGGDPARVVGIGQSAGSRNLCAIAGSPLANGLLRGVILQSGACNLRSLSDKYLFGQDVVRQLGCSGAVDIAECLRRAPVEELVNALPGLPDVMTISPYNPAIDGWSLVGDPLVRLRSGAHGIPLIVGSNSAEVGQVMPWITREEQYQTLVQALFGADTAPAVLGAYPLSNYASPRDALVAAVTEARYTCSALDSANAAAAGGSAYLYTFSQALAAGPESAFGAYHGLELLFLFHAFTAHGYEPTDEERRLSIDLASYYAHFAESGDPQPPDDAPPWPRYAPSTEPFLRLDTPIVPDAQPAGARCAIWALAE